jgi:four helix bundle protein
MSDRCLAVAELLHAEKRFLRLIEQFAASSTSISANIVEADEAMSRKDFRKCLCISIKEHAETRFWLRLFVRRGWVTQSKINSLQKELEEIRLILGTILARTAPSKASPRTRD